MKKVGEYLDKYFHITEDGRSSNINSKGEFGHWCYPHPDLIIYKKSNYPFESEKLPQNSMTISCNNQTMQFNVIVDGEYQCTYGYLQTYDHIPRGEADSQGYYARSTDEEVIGYIEKFKKQIDKKQHLDREKKLKRILDV